MSLHRFISIIRRVFGRERALVRCAVSIRRRLPVVLFVFLLFSVARLASASILVSGDVTPTDNPFTTAINEGLPSDGNFVNPFEDPDKQTYFEGRHLDNNVADLTDDTNENIDEIIVGQSSYGVLLISGESALRDQALTIGASGTRGPSGSGSGQVYAGTGVVRITGFGSLYNNDPSIIPPGLPTNFSSQTPRDPNGADGNGNDLFVGRAGTETTPSSGTSIVGGTGTLEISAGARAEIQDAVVVVRDTNSTGSIIVDGFDSFLGNGGFQASGATAEDHQMIVGKLGVGYMTITNGGSVRSDAPVGSGGSTNVGPVGAVIGSPSFAATVGQMPDPGGVGTVTVNGTASKWVIGGSLQIGGFDIGLQGMTLGNQAGDMLQYNNEAGRGFLYVQDGGLVNVVNALDADANDPKLLLAVGRFGRIILSGGLINVGGVTGQNNEARANSVQLINDGVISGTGRIETGVFNNRYLGEIRVDAGQSLVIDASADVTGVVNSPPLTNYGVMQVIGTVESRAELEFDRAPAAPLAPIQPFQNLRVDRPMGAPVGDFYGGLISAQNATLRFRSGLQNSGMMAFTAGNNYVTGNVVNMAAPPAMPLDPGIIIISGPNTKVTFEEDLINAGTLTISGGATLEVLARHSFVTTGNLNFTITPNSSNQIFSAGDAGISGKLSLNLSGFSFGSLNVGDVFPILSVSGSLGGVDLSDPNYPVPDLTVPPSFDLVSFPNMVAFGLPATTALVPIYTSNSVLVSVVSWAAASGPDFNGDGVVDNLDLQIWLANDGLTSGASVVQGDADGDGDVDGVDFLIWQQNLGPYPGAGAGSGSALAAAVPEPTGFVLLLIGGLFSVPIRQRYRVRQHC